MEVSRSHLSSSRNIRDIHNFYKAICSGTVTNRVYDIMSVVNGTWSTDVLHREYVSFCSKTTYPMILFPFMTIFFRNNVFVKNSFVINFSWTFDTCYQWEPWNFGRLLCQLDLLCPRVFVKTWSFDSHLVYQWHKDGGWNHTESKGPCYQRRKVQQLLMYSSNTQTKD